jgi:hypothetical protein
MYATGFEKAQASNSSPLTLLGPHEHGPGSEPATQTENRAQD